MKSIPRHGRQMLRTGEQGHTLIVVLLATALLLYLAVTLVQTISPAYRTTFESASWHDSLQAAEGGVDLAISSVQASAPDPTANPWTGWTNSTGNVNGPWGYTGLATDSYALAHLGEGNTNAKLAQLTVDVYTRDSNLSIDPLGSPWYRIHSVALADVPGNKLASLDKRDAQLRRMRFTTDATHPNTGVARGVEVIARPIYLLKFAIWSVNTLTLGSSNSWLVDSFNSNNGAYSSTTTTGDGNVATNSNFLSLNGGTIYGNIRTQGGDNHATYYGAKDASGNTITSGYYENIGGATYLPGGPTATNPSGVQNSTGTISDDFTQQAIPIMMPAWASATSTTVLSTPTGSSSNPTFVAGPSASAPTYYVLNQNTISGFTVVAPTGLAAGQKAYVNIALNGDIRGKSFVIPPNVVVKFYANGNVDFQSGNTNINGSGVAPNFQIYGVQGVTMVNGVPTYTGTGTAPYFAMGGGESFTGAFYGPQYNINFNGNSNVFGSIVGATFTQKGGGSSAFHYDDALGNNGELGGYEIASYTEDNRLQP